MRSAVSEEVVFGNGLAWVGGWGLGVGVGGGGGTMFNLRSDYLQPSMSTDGG